MSRPARILSIVGASLACLLILVVAAALITVQTPWFQKFARTKIVEAIQDGTGARTEVGSFVFDLGHLRAEIHDLVLHGTEAPPAAPLFRAKLVAVNLKLNAPFQQIAEVTYLYVDQPQANIMVFPDGRTNLPTPKTQGSSNGNGLQTVVNLAIQKFDLQNGSAVFANRKTDFSASGRNLRAQLAYNTGHPSYLGEIDISPLVLSSANGTPANVTVKLPITIEPDRIALSGASVSTGESRVMVAAAVDHLQAPHAAAHIVATISLDEARRTAGLKMTLDTRRGPRVLTADLSGTADAGNITIQNSTIRLGETEIRANGPLKDAGHPGAMQFQARFAVAEIGRLLGLSSRPAGTLQIEGKASLGANSDYRVAAAVAGRELAAGLGSTRISGVQLDSGITANPQEIAVNGLRVRALGGEVTGSGSLEKMQTFAFAGKLQNFDIQKLAALAKPGGKLGYAGAISGDLRVNGDLTNSKSMAAQAALTIRPRPGGIPVRGDLAGSYSAAADSVKVAPSYITLPNTRLDMSGTLEQQIQIKLVTRNAADFQPVASIPVRFQGGGSAAVMATVRGHLSNPTIGAQLTSTNFSVEGRPFTRLTGNVTASPAGASVMDLSLSHGSLQALVNGSVGLRDWKPVDSAAVRVDASIRNADVADLLALAGQSPVAARGALTADAHVNGTVGDPRGNAMVSVQNGSVEDEPFDSLTTTVVMTQGLIELPSLQWIAGGARLDANARYQHQPRNLKYGTISAHIATNQVQLAQFRALVKNRPGLAGLVSLNADAAATVDSGGSETTVQVTNVNLNLSARGIQMENKNLGDVTATAKTTGTAVEYTVSSNFAGSSVRLNGQSQLSGKHETTATAQISDLPIDRMLAVAGTADLPVRGVLAANAQLSGTIDAPHATATVNIRNGSAYQQNFTRLDASVDYSDVLINLANLRIEDAGNSIDASGSLSHPAGNLHQGKIRFRVRSNQLNVARLHALGELKAGLTGSIAVEADGEGALAGSGIPRFSRLDASLTTKGLAVDRKAVGDLALQAETQGQEVNFRLTSDFGHANIQGNGTLGLTGAYPVNAQLDLRDVTYSGLANWIGMKTRTTFDAALDGQVRVSGPAGDTRALRGSLQLTKLEAHSMVAKSGGVGNVSKTQFEVHNDGPILVELDRSVVTIQSARLAGPFTNLALTGSAPIGTGQNMNLRATGTINLAGLQAFDPGIYASGGITLNAAVTGTTAKPNVNGQIQLQKASLNLVNLPNGISNATGTIAFNGSEAVIQNLTGQSGGGQVTLSGAVGFGGPQIEARVQARVERVQVQATESISVQTSAQLSLVGTTTSSLLSGTVRISQLAMRSHTDIGSILNSAAAPPSAPSQSMGFLAGMKFDVRIVTTSGAQFRSSLTQNLQADVNLTLRGNPDHPGMIGRVAINQGNVVFFGSKYNVDQGTITFFNPNEIDPVLDINLSTTVQGVDVSLSVTGSIDKMTLSYRTDPPMEFKDIISLLGSGSPPTTDPVLAARQQPPPQQNLAQAGASALLGQAVASPVAGRLQRLFGVSTLKINPQVTGSSNTPAATLTLEQQINNSLTFTYIQDVTQSNPQDVRVEWAINPRWSAIAARDVTGEVSVDLFYKKRFH